jgi:F-type H+-transporting ATPase subunit delta
MELSRESNTVDVVYGEVMYVAAVSQHSEFANLLKSPIVHSSKKVVIFSEIFSGKLGELSQSFFKLVIKKGRESLFTAICAAFEEQYHAYKEQSPITIYSASELESSSLKEIEGKILALGITRQNLIVTTKIDSSLLGGFIVEAGDVRWDHSLSGKLERMRKHLIKN